ncbi:MAG: ComEC/Rec2 family competence protein, partial [Oscillospiraceae bacterium]
TIDGVATRESYEKETSAKIYCNRKNGFTIGDEVKAKFKDNPEFFDTNSLRSEKVYLRGYCTYIEKIANGQMNTFQMIKLGFVNLREAFKICVDENLWNSTKGFVLAVISGDNSLMTEETYESLVNSGIVHIVAVSGMHLTIFYFYAQVICGLLHFGRRQTLVFCVVCIIAYSLFCTSAYSIFRSLDMILVLIFAKFSRRVYDSRTALGFVAILFLVSNPYAVCDVGFMLSFGATIGIVLFYKKIFILFGGKLQKHSNYLSMKDKILNKVIALLAVGVAANILTVPIILLFFGTFNTYSVFTTLVISWIIPVLFCLVPLFVVEVLIFGKGMFVAFVINKCVTIVLGVSAFVSQLPYAVIHTGDNYVIITICIVYAVGFLLWFFKARTKTVVMVSSCFLMIISGGYILHTERQPQYYKIGVFDDAVMFSSGEKSFLFGNVKNDFLGKNIEKYMLEQKIPMIDFQIIDKKLTKASRANYYLVENGLVGDVFVSQQSDEYIDEIKKIMDETQNINEFWKLNVKLDGFSRGKTISFKEIWAESTKRKNKSHVISVGDIKLLKQSEKCDIIVSSSATNSQDSEENITILPYNAVISAMEHYNNDKCQRTQCFNCQIINTVFNEYDGIFMAGHSPTIKKKESLRLSKTFTGYTIIYIKK